MVLQARGRGGAEARGGVPARDSEAAAADAGARSAGARDVSARTEAAHALGGGGDGERWERALVRTRAGNRRGGGAERAVARRGRAHGLACRQRAPAPPRHVQLQRLHGDVGARGGDRDGAQRARGVRRGGARRRRGQGGGGVRARRGWAGRARVQRRALPPRGDADVDQGGGRAPVRRAAHRRGRGAPRERRPGLGALPLRDGLAHGRARGVPPRGAPPVHQACHQSRRRRQEAARLRPEPEAPPALHRARPPGPRGARPRAPARAPRRHALPLPLPPLRPTRRPRVKVLPRSRARPPECRNLLRERQGRAALAVAAAPALAQQRIVRHRRFVRRLRCRRRPGPGPRLRRRRGRCRRGRRQRQRHRTAAAAPAEELRPLRARAPARRARALELPRASRGARARGRPGPRPQQAPPRPERRQLVVRDRTPHLHPPPLRQALHPSLLRRRPARNLSLGRHAVVNPTRIRNRRV
mmetsp:Transcript_7127/g.23624  ORF Transcript_7127/g.23624 Transcript_7127/m.23624 type:complete len:472 (+) Transcript_7127:797-2212(+)